MLDKGKKNPKMLIYSQRPALFLHTNQDIFPH